MDYTELQKTVKTLPHRPGVYLYKDADDVILYAGKAKDLRNRVASYVQRQGIDWKVDAIVEGSIKLEHIETASELEAMLLEAELIQSHKPKFNVLLKNGQPFLYFLITKGPLPELTMTRIKKAKGTYFGPFIDKTGTRKVYSFLLKNFQLKICNKKVKNGCLYYHLGQCAGSCRDDFDKAAYLERLSLAQKFLSQGQKKFLALLENEIVASNAAMEYEKSQKLHALYQSLEGLFGSLKSDIFKTGLVQELTEKDIWILNDHGRTLSLFTEDKGLVKKRQSWYVIADDEHHPEKLYEQYFISYYRETEPTQTILMNMPLTDKSLVEEFLTSWHHREHHVSLIQPTSGHYADLVRLAEVMQEQAQQKVTHVPDEMQKMFKLKKAPHTIDCFDISHKQGTFMVGACIRFTDGMPDKNMFRRFKIKTVAGNDDYACLREVVTRRYQEGQALPDLVVIDGGKGQLNAVKDLFPQLEFISLAKREERIFTPHLPEGKKLDIKTGVGQLLIALRDYTHHFAISYHRLLAETASIKE